MGLLFSGGSSTQHTTTNQTDNKATTQTGTAVSTAGGTANITDGEVYSKGIKAFENLFNRQLETSTKQQSAITSQTKKLVDLMGNLFQRKSESDSKELTEKALKWGAVLLGVYFTTKVFYK